MKQENPPIEAKPVKQSYEEPKLETREKLNEITEAAPISKIVL